MLRYLLGKDVFVSYSREDGLHYAAALASKLKATGRTVAFDQWGSSAKASLPWRLKLSLRWASGLVIVGTPAAAGSAHVEWEVANFPKSRDTVVPIDFSGSIASARWAGHVKGLAWQPQSIEDLQNGAPTQSCIDRIENTLSSTKQTRRVRNGFIAAFLVLALLLAATGWNIKRSIDAGMVAEATKIVADNAKSAAEGAEARALQAEKRASEAETSAISRIKEASEAVGRAEEARARARSLELAALARAQFDSDPRAAISLAVEAARVRPTADADAARRTAIALDRTAVILNGHAGAVSRVVFNTNGKRVYTAGLDGYVKVWDASSGRLLESIGRAGSEINRLSITADEKHVLIGTWYPQKFEVWTTHKPQRLWAFDGDAVSNALARPGEVIAYGDSPHILERRSIVDGAPLGSFGKQEHSRISAGMVISRSGRFAAERAAEYGVTVWDIDTNKSRVLIPGAQPSGAVDRLLFSASDKFLVASHEGGAVRAWDLTKPGGEPLMSSVLHHGRPAEISVSDDGEVLVSVGRLDSAAFRSNISHSINARPEATPVHHEGGVSVAAIDATGRFAVTASLQEIKLWQLGTPPQWVPLRANLVGHKGTITDLAFSPDGSIIASASADGSVRLWRPDSLTLAGGCDRSSRLTLDTSVIQGLWMSPAAAVADANWKSTVLEWACDLGHNVPSRTTSLSYVTHLRSMVAGTSEGMARGQQLFKPDHVIFALVSGKDIRFLRTSSDGRWTVVGIRDDDFVYVVGGSGKNELRRIKLPSAVYDAAISTDGRVVALWGLGDENIGYKVWLWQHERNGAPVDLSLSRPPTDAQFSPDGRALITVDLGGYVKAWSIPDGRLLKEFKQKSDGRRSTAHAIRFVPDGSHILVSTQDGVVDVFDSSLTPLRQFKIGQAGTVSTMVVSPDGHTLFSADEHGILRAHDWRMGRQLAEVVNLAGLLLAEQIAVSPGGRYVAVSTNKKFAVFECSFCGRLEPVTAINR